MVDNYHTHKHDDINQWLAKHPRVQLHSTPTSGSWLNLVEVFFGIITRQAIRRGSFNNVRELVTAIRAFIDGWNDRAHPFTWTKTADQILPHTTRKRDSDARHYPPGLVIVLTVAAFNFIGDGLRDAFEQRLRRD